MTSRILFVDNDVDFSATRSEFLEQEGFEIVQAQTLSEAEWHLENTNIHLVIIDIRMKDDDDEKDVSGLAFAKKTNLSSIPKIILTGFTSLGYVRDVMRPPQTGLPAAIDFIAKQDGPDVLIAAVKRAFNDIIKINWELDIDERSNNPFSLVRLITPDLEGKRLLNRAEELEDLFRSLFYESEYIRFNHLLWKRDNRLALVVHAFQENSRPESYIVVCGHNTFINEEARRFQNFAPKAYGVSGTSLHHKAESIHYAGCVYTLANYDLDSFQTLRGLYDTGTEKDFNSSVTALFQETLKAWHQGKSIYLKDRTLSDLYFENLNLSPDLLNIESLTNRIKNLMRQALTLGVSIELSENNMILQYNELFYSLPNPIDCISHTIDSSKEALAINVPGSLTGENILVDNFCGTRLTDFGDAGQAHIAWNFVSLEAAIRFDWIETNEILRRQELEQCLIQSEFSRLNLQELEPKFRRPARAIQVIRKLATRSVGKNIITYHQGISFQAIRRLVEFNLKTPLTSSELARMTQILISLALLAPMVVENKSTPVNISEDDSHELRIDVTTNTVLLGNQKRRLSPRPFKLLKYLYENADRVCTTEELRQNVIGENYNTTYVHTLIGRIREVIEDDPNQDHYLITEPNLGYLLRKKHEQD